MNKAFRIIQIVCILPILSFFLGCGSDNPAAVEEMPELFLGGTIGVYADAEGNHPNLLDTGGAVTYCVVHKVTEGATASAFKIEAPAGWTLLGAEAQFPVAIGNVDEGISVGYGACMTGSIHVMSVTYASPGNSNGETFKVSPNMQWPEHIRVVDCDAGQLANAIGEETPITLWTPGVTPGSEDKNKRMDKR